MGIYSSIKRRVDSFIAGSQKDAVQTWDHVAQTQIRRGNNVAGFGAWSAMQLAKAGPRSALDLGKDVAALSTGALAVRALGTIPRVGQLAAAGYEASMPLRRALHFKDMVQRTTHPNISGGRVYSTLSAATLKQASASSGSAASKAMPSAHSGKAKAAGGSLAQKLGASRQSHATGAHKAKKSTSSGSHMNLLNRQMTQQVHKSHHRSSHRSSHHSIAGKRHR